MQLDSKEVALNTLVWGGETAFFEPRQKGGYQKAVRLWWQAACMGAECGDKRGEALIQAYREDARNLISAYLEEKPDFNAKRENQRQEALAMYEPLLALYREQFCQGDVQLLDCGAEAAYGISILEKGFYTDIVTSLGFSKEKVRSLAAKTDAQIVADLGEGGEGQPVIAALRWSAPYCREAVEAQERGDAFDRLGTALAVWEKAVAEAADKGEIAYARAKVMRCFAEAPGGQDQDWDQYLSGLIKASRLRSGVAELELGTLYNDYVFDPESATKPLQGREQLFDLKCLVRAARHMMLGGAKIVAQDKPMDLRLHCDTCEMTLNVVKSILPETEPTKKVMARVVERLDAVASKTLLSVMRPEGTYAAVDLTRKNER